jgi:hypothetical protein
MPAMPPSRASVRSAAVINQEIRELAGRIGLSEAERDRLIGLWAEWQDAVAREAGLAA